MFRCGWVVLSSWLGSAHQTCSKGADAQPAAFCQENHLLQTTGVLTKVHALDQETGKIHSTLVQAWCSAGIASRGKCCAASCGSCGGSGCSGFPGGKSQCCKGAIQKANRQCEDPEDTACVFPHFPPQLVIFDDANPALSVSPGSVSGTGQLGWQITANAALEVNQNDNICGISFKCDTAESHLMIGFASMTVAGWTQIDHGVKCRGNFAPRLDIYEKGSFGYTLPNRPANGNPSTDVYAIRINGNGQVEYLLNDSEYYTSSRDVTYPWHVGLDAYTSPSLSDVQYLTCA